MAISKPPGGQPPEDDTGLLVAALNHAWTIYETGISHLYQVLNYYLVAGTILAAAYASVFNAKHYGPAAIFSIAGMGLTALAFTVALDQRRTIEQAEPAIIELEDQVASKLDIGSVRIVKPERGSGIIKIGLPAAGLAALVNIGALPYVLSAADTDDVGQSVWLQLVKHLGNIRDPAALPGWLTTTTRRECQRVLNPAQAPDAAKHGLDTGNIPDDQAKTIEQGLLVAERHAALREAFAHLPPCCQQLIALLIEDPPVPYAEISARLGIPVGSIGPNRRRSLDKLRHHPAIAALINAEAETA